MKKVIIAIASLILFTSCKKDKHGCWICETQGMVAGVNWDGKHKEVCNGSDTVQPDVTDDQGNAIGSPNGCKKEF